MVHVTLYVNAKQLGHHLKSVYFKHEGKFYRTNVSVKRLNDLSVEEYRKRIRASISSVLKSGNLEKHRIENKGLVYAAAGIRFDDL